MVTLLWPRIRKQNQDLVERGGGELPLQYLHRIMTDDPHVAERVLLQSQQQVADPGSMHFDTDEVALRVPAGKVQEMLAIAESDLQGAWRIATEARRQIQHDGLELEAETWPKPR